MIILRKLIRPYYINAVGKTNMAVLRKCEFFLVQKEKSITPTSQRISVFNAFWHNDRNYYELLLKCDIVLMTACNMWFCSQCKELLLLQKKNWALIKSFWKLFYLISYSIDAELATFQTFWIKWCCETTITCRLLY